MLGELQKEISDEDGKSSKLIKEESKEAVAADSQLITEETKGEL